MLRSLLVALDETAASMAAQQLAIGLARSCRAEITGLAILDRSHLTAPLPLRLGGDVRRQRRRAELAREREILARLEARFEALCAPLSTAWQVIEGEGLPRLLLEEEVVRHDLLVVGRDTDFHHDQRPGVAAVVQRLMRDTPRPVIVCPDTLPAEGPILAATDGSRHALRALHMLALLGPGHGRPVHVLAIAASQDEAERRAGHPAELLAKHGFTVTVEGVATDDDPGAIILRHAAARGVGMIALGAAGRGPLREFLLGTTADQLLRAAPCPLFLHH